MKRLACVIAAGFLATAVCLAATPAPKKKQATGRTLTEGSYTAKIKALACEGCAGIIESTMKKFPGVESASVEQKSSSLTFKVRKGAKVTLSVLQKALNLGAKDMGMGADYSLYELKGLKKT